MYHKLFALLILFVAVWQRPLVGQSLQQLAVGDDLSTYRLHPALFSKDTTIDLGAQPSPLIILDFWATWCSSCVAGFPKAYALQQQFKGQVQFILINSKSPSQSPAILRQTPEKVKTFLDKRRKDYSFPCIVEDTVIRRMLPASITIPFYIWIKEGKVIGLTGPERINQENIQRALASSTSQPFTLPTSIPSRMLHNTTLAEISGKNISAAAVVSTFLGQVEGFHGASALIPLGRFPDRLHHFSLNAPILSHFYFAYPQMSEVSSANCVHEKFATVRPANLAAGEWWINRDSLYSYELVIPATLRDSARIIAQKDLLQFTGTVPRFYQKKVKCFVLTLRDSSLLDVFVEEGSARDSNLSEKGSEQKFMHGQSFSYEFMSSINKWFGLYFVDDTNIPADKLINLDGLPADLTDVPKLKKALKKYGIALRAKRRTLSFAEVVYNKH